MQSVLADVLLTKNEHSGLIIVDNIYRFVVPMPSL